jgi:hypothetical protein
MTAVGTFPRKETAMQPSRRLLRCVSNKQWDREHASFLFYRHAKTFSAADIDYIVSVPSTFH